MELGRNIDSQEPVISMTTIITTFSLHCYVAFKQSVPSFDRSSQNLSQALDRYYIYHICTLYCIVSWNVSGCFESPTGVACEKAPKSLELEPREIWQQSHPRKCLTGTMYHCGHIQR